MKQDLTIAVRFPEEVANWLESTAEEEQRKHPESRITTSTIVSGIREKTGRGLNHCVAAAAVTIINRGLTKNNKLPGWFKEEKE